MHRMDMTKETKEEELQEIIRTVLEDESKKEFIKVFKVLCAGVMSNRKEEE